MKKLKLGIVGASGLVGETILNVLKEERLLSQYELYLITSKKSEGKNIKFNGKNYTYILLDNNIFKLNLDIVIFSAGDDISKLWAKSFAHNGTYVIDNSNAFRRDDNVPLIVPEINGKILKKENKIISNPNCSTIQLAVVLDKLLKIYNIENVIVSSYQSVSGAGRDALDDLKNNTTNIFQYKIKNNIIAQIGDIEDNGFCKEENKIMFETNKILNSNINVLATTVRVPTSYCHGESVYIKFPQKVDIFTIKNALKCKYIDIFDKICQNDDYYNKNNTAVFRMRMASSYEFLCFILADNLRRGAAFNAVGILKLITKFL